MKEHYVNSLNNFIGGWYLEDTTICDKIIEFHRTSQSTPGKVGNTINKDVKDSLDVILDTNRNLLVEYSTELSKVLDLYSSKFGPFVQDCAPFGAVEAINIQHYPPGGGYKRWHTERDNAQYPFRNRYLAFMTYLNDVDNDGETEFYYQQLKIKPEKGLTLMWGVDWTFTHRGVESSQEKYIATGWLSFEKDNYGQT